MVVHVEAESGPIRSLFPRLAQLAARGASLTVLVPAEGPAAATARDLGKVHTGGPGALMFPMGPSGAWRPAHVLVKQRRLVRQLVLATGSELVLVTSPTMPGALLGAKKAKAATVLYGGEVLERGGLRALAGKALARLAARSTDVVITPSKAAAEPYERLGANVRVVPPPIPEPPPPQELRRRGAALREKLGLAADATVVASLGAITWGRGQHVLADALLAAGDEEWQLVIGGGVYNRPRDRAYAAELRERIAGLNGRLSMIGPVEDPWALYAAADVFVNPALIPEGFGRATCEALAARCPVVSTSVGGVREALRDGETALLVEPGSAQALTAAIERLLDDRALAKRLADAGAADVARRFALDAAQGDFEAALASAIRA